MDIKILDAAKIEPEAKPQEVATPPVFEQEGVFVKERVADLFNMSTDDARREGRKLETLIEYAKTKSDDHSPDGVYWALKQLGLRLGTPPLGEKIIDHAYMYARLYLETQSNKKKMDTLMRGEKDE